MSIVKLKIETLVTMGLMLSAPVVAVGVGVGADAATGKAETAQSRGDSQNVGVDTTKRLTKGGLAEAGMAAACSTSDMKCCNYSEIQGDTCCPNLKVGPTRANLTIAGLREIQSKRLTKANLQRIKGGAVACSTSDTKCCNYSEIQGDTCCPNLKVGPTRQTLTIEGLRQIQDRQKK
ncbi:MAG: hypothetical protein ABIT61_05540 [Steroidobacteraceae bacterium]